MDPRPRRRADAGAIDRLKALQTSQWIPGRVVALTPHLEVVMWLGFGRPYWRTSAFLVEIAVKFGWVRRMASFADEYRGRRDRGSG